MRMGISIEATDLRRKTGYLMECQLFAPAAETVVDAANDIRENSYSNGQVVYAKVSAARLQPAAMTVQRRSLYLMASSRSTYPT